MKKKIFAVSLAALLLCACGGDKGTVSDNATAAVEAAASPAGGDVSPAATDAPAAAAEEVRAAGSISSSLNTGNLSESGSGYEGTEGTGAFNYGEALQKSILFYELQRSGALPEEVRCNWRGDSALNDGADAGVDLTGGWYDAGDHVKFNLPMAYTGAMLAWSVYEDRAAYEESGQLTYMLDDLRWVNDYLMKCHASDGVYYYQLGDGGSDHSWWGPAEVLPMERPSYKVTKDQPGSAVAAEAAASLAAASCVFDGDYAAECLKHARELYAMADEWRSDSGYTQANGFYDSHSGFYDELAWSAAWLYLATGEDKYLEAAKKDYGAKEWDFNWSLCWDDVHIGAAALLAEAGAGKTYTDAIEKHLDYWTKGTDGQRITYTPKGLAWLDGWGPLRYATTTAFVAALYSRGENCPADKKDTYWDFAVSQADYALGSSGRSFVCGFGENPPVHPHHRTSQGSYSNNMNEPAEARHTLYGALVGGPDASDNYTDEVSNYQTNEVACDYNAGFTGLLAALYSVYHGQTIKDFGAVEPAQAEYFVEAGVNVDGDDFIEVKAYVYNESAWPARAARDLELRYFVDLSEVYDAGGTAENIELSNNYMSGGRVDGLKIWEEDKHLYYLSVVFDDASLYPGGQEHYKKEIQVRMRNGLGVWDNENDPSFAGIGGSGQTQTAQSIALYEDGVLIWGSEPEGGANAGVSVSAAGEDNKAEADSADKQADTKTDTKTDTDKKALEQKLSAGNAKLSVNLRYDGMGSSATALAGNMEVKNEGGGSIKLKDLKIKYYFTKEGSAELIFDCYHAAVQGAGGAYNALSKVKGSFSAASGEDCDSLCTISFDENTELGEGDSLVVNFSIHLSDWAAMNTANDWSVESAEHIVFDYAGSTIFGTEP